MNVNKICSFFGHRKIIYDNRIVNVLKEIIEDLILNKNVNKFLFGSKSEFNTLCHLIVTELKDKYPYIQRIGYPCYNELFILEENIDDFKKKFYDLFNKEIKIYGVEEIFSHRSRYTAGKSSYIERNYSMIDNSDFCVFYYDVNYKPQIKRHNRKSYYQSKSGTCIAYEYAKRNKKCVINVLDYKA